MILFLKSYQVSLSSFSPRSFSSSHFLFFHLPPPTSLLLLHYILIMIISRAVGGFKGIAPPCFNNSLGCSFALWREHIYSPTDLYVSAMNSTAVLLKQACDKEPALKKF